MKRHLAAGVLVRSAFRHGKQAFFFYCFEERPMPAHAYRDLLYNLFNLEDIENFEKNLYAIKDSMLEGTLSTSASTCKSNLLILAIKERKTNFLIVILNRIKKITDQKTRKIIINKKDGREITPLGEAVFEENLQHVTLLLNIKETNPTLIIMACEKKTTALHVAAIYNPEILKIILEKSSEINIDVQDEDGMPPIMCAALAKQFESMKILLEKNALLTMPGSMKANLLDYFFRMHKSYKDFESFLKAIKKQYEIPGLEEKKHEVFTDLIKENQMGCTPFYALIPDQEEKLELREKIELSVNLELYLQTFGCYIHKKDFLKLLIDKLPFSQGGKFVKQLQANLSHLCDDNVNLIFNHYLKNTEKPFHPSHAPAAVCRAWEAIMIEYQTIKNTLENLKPETTRPSEEKIVSPSLKEKMAPTPSEALLENTFPITPGGLFLAASEEKQDCPPLYAADWIEEEAIPASSVLLEEKSCAHEGLKDFIFSTLTHSEKHILIQKLKTFLSKHFQNVTKKSFEHMSAYDMPLHKLIGKRHQKVEVHLSFKKSDKIFSYVCDQTHLSTTKIEKGTNIFCLHQRKNINFYLIDQKCRLDETETDKFIHYIHHEGGLHLETEKGFFSKAAKTGSRLFGTHVFHARDKKSEFSYSAYLLDEKLSHSCYKTKLKGSSTLHEGELLIVKPTCSSFKEEKTYEPVGSHPDKGQSKKGKGPKTTKRV